MIKSVIHLLIDGYNLLHFMANRGELKTKDGSLEQRRSLMLSRLSRYRSDKNVEITVVFDSSDPQLLFSQRSKVGGVQVVFTDDTESADDYILRACEASPRAYVVVSDDEEVCASAKLNDCISVRCSEFLPKLTALQLSPEALLEKDSGSSPLYPRVSTKKKGVAKRLSKNLRKKKNWLKNL